MIEVVEGEVLSSFVGREQDARQHWRSIVLFGRNVASYKFSLAKSLIELAGTEQEFIDLGELAQPFARNVCEHIAKVDRQSTSRQSKFLDACRYKNAHQITESELLDVTVAVGFENVLDAFHRVGDSDVPTRFFVDERKTGGGIRLTDGFFSVMSNPQSFDLLDEAESRWRLVEEAWDSRADGQQLQVLYQSSSELLVPSLKGKRKSISEVRPALNGYQKGHCFYCFAPIQVGLHKGQRSHVDHFFPHMLMAKGINVNLDSPWNLVLACATCNCGPGGKFAALPNAKYIARLHKRNEFLIGSHHPLRESIMYSTGMSAKTRQSFLLATMDRAIPVAKSAIGWLTAEVDLAAF